VGDDELLVWARRLGLFQNLELSFWVGKEYLPYRQILEEIIEEVKRPRE
jgi:hypothetical protein